MDVSNHFWISPQDTSTPERIALQSMDNSFYNTENVQFYIRHRTGMERCGEINKMTFSHFTKN